MEGIAKYCMHLAEPVDLQTFPSCFNPSMYVRHCPQRSHTDGGIPIHTFTLSLKSEGALFIIADKIGTVNGRKVCSSTYA